MAHDVFISYSSHDKVIANAVCATLEKNAIRCWIAPRDVSPGEPWASSLVRAIQESQLFVLILSQGSNASGQVLREVEQAVDRGIPIIPLRIENVEPTEAMRYYIKSLHWLDAMSPPIERHLERLTESVRTFLGIAPQDDATPKPLATEMAGQQPKRRTPAWFVVIAILAAAGILTGVGIWASKALQHPTPQESNITLTALPNLVENDLREEDAAETALPNNVENEWMELSFNIPNDILWTKTKDGVYAITGSEDTFAWADEFIEGDFILKTDVQSDFSDYGEGMILVYGNGNSWSKGCLIFNITGYWQAIRVHSLYDPDVEWLSQNELLLDFETRDTYEMIIEVTDGIANLYVDGELVAASALRPYVNRQGQIALVKYGASNAVTFSNIRFKSLEAEP